MKDFFKKEDFPLIHNGDPEIRIKIATCANQLLASRMKTAHGQLSSGGIPCLMSDDQCGDDTHEIHYYTTPIKEETPKCKVNHEEYKLWMTDAKFCSQCGTDLS